MLDRDDQKDMSKDRGGKGGTAGGGKSPSGGGNARSGAGGGGGVRGGPSTGGKKESAGSKATSSKAGAGPARSPARSGPGGAGGIRSPSVGPARPSQTSDRVTKGLLGGTIKSNPSKAAQLTGLNRLDRNIVEAGTRFGKKIGLDTGYGISMMDPTRFSGFRPNTNLAQVNPSALTRLVNAQLAFGKPLQVNAGYALTGHQKKGAHPMGLAIDVQVPTPEDRFDFVKAATQAGFTHTGTYGHGKRGVHVDTRPGMGNWGANLHSTSTPAAQKAAIAEGLRTPADWGGIAAGMNGGLPTMASQPSAPSPARTATVDPRSRALPQPKPSNFEPEARARSVLAGLGVNPARSFADIPARTPNMPMGGYVSPMASVGGMPPAPGRMDMGGYTSPMANVGGMPPAPGRMDMGGYQSPMASVGGLPEAVTPDKMQDRIAPEQPSTRSPMAMQGPGLLASPNVNLDRFRAPPSTFPGRPEQPGAFPAAEQPNMDMSGYRSPMAFSPSGMPRAPSNPAGGMSFNPTPPRNPVGGMSFNPSLPGMMPGPSRSRSPMVTPNEPQIAQNGNRPRALGLENYQGSTPQVASVPDPSPGGFFKGFGETIKNGVSTAGKKIAAGAETVWDNLNNPDLGFVRGPGANNPVSRGGQGGGDGAPIQWTGLEPPEMVADMQQHVEDVLRSVLFQSQTA